MLQLGDVIRINGGKIPPADVIIGGSPCQDLSVAGKRAGLAGERSGLFLEQIRIIREMRDKTDGKYPGYMVWENVPGAFSANKGEDFRRVLEETEKIGDQNAAVPGPPGGKWTTAGSIVADGWSIAWRVLDAQFWGVPQRRRRIALVADFGGQSAPEILFERRSLSGDSEACGTEGEGAPGNAQMGAAYPVPDGRCMTSWDICTGFPFIFENHGQDSRITGPLHISPTISQKFGTGGNNTPIVLASGQENAGISTDVSATLTCKHEQPILAFAKTVRRLTPLECERLQGFPDGWTDIGEWTDSRGRRRKTFDTARYKALGNSIALPPWRYVLSRLSLCIRQPGRIPTMGSLFDGIGGFPLIWREINGEDSVLWISETDDFCRAVTEKRG